MSGDVWFSHFRCLSIFLLPVFLSVLLASVFRSSFHSSVILLSFVCYFPSVIYLSYESFQFIVQFAIYRSELFVKDKRSSLVVFEDVQGKNQLSMDSFVEFARRYKLAGGPFEDLCEHNAAIAEELGHKQIAATWRIMSVFFWRHSAASTVVGGIGFKNGPETGVFNSNNVIGVGNNNVNPPGSVSSLSGFVSGSGSGNISRTTSNVSNLPHLDIKLALANYVDEGRDGGGVGTGGKSTPQTLGNGESTNVFASALGAASANADSLAQKQHQKQQQQDDNSNLGGSDEESDDPELDTDQEKNLTSIASGQGLVSLNSDLFYDPADFYQALNRLKIKKDTVNHHQQRQLNGDGLRTRSSTFNDPMEYEDLDDDDDEEESWRESTKQDDDDDDDDDDENSNWVLPSEAIDPRQDILEKSPSSSPNVRTLVSDGMDGIVVDGQGVMSSALTAHDGQSSLLVSADAMNDDVGGAAGGYSRNDVDAWNIEKVNNRRNFKNRDKQHQGNGQDDGLLSRGGVISKDVNPAAAPAASDNALPPPPKREAATVIPLSAEALFTPTFWDGSDMLLKMMHFYADRGDIQMTVSCLLALDDKVKSKASH